MMNIDCPQYHSGNIHLYNCDCMDVMKQIPDNSVDAVITDPPYELGFMGKAWDASGIAYNVELWRECLRVLKPGGHLLAFGGTRTYHRMAVAIEDAGFEVRDMLEWIYFSGFPKSLNIQKALLKKLGYGNIQEYETSQKKIKSQMSDVWKGIISKTLAQKEDNDRGDLSCLLEDLEQGTQHEIFTHRSIKEKSIQISERQEQSCLERWSDLPTPQGELYCKCKVCEMPTGFYINGKKRWLCYGTQISDSKITWEVIDENGVCSSYQSQSIRQSLGELNVICEQCGTQIIRVQGLGSATKPAHEPIIMARKPLSEKTIVENVLKHGTGAIDIDSCRIPTKDNDFKGIGGGGVHGVGNKVKNTVYGEYDVRVDIDHSVGRFPANIICTDDALNDGVITKTNKGTARKTGVNKSMFGNILKEGTLCSNGDSGSKSRYFDIDVWAEKHGLLQFPKASKRERNEGCEGLEEKERKNNANFVIAKCKNCGLWIGNEWRKQNRPLSNCQCENPEPQKEEQQREAVKNHHPTVKPVHLMSWLVRLVSKEGDTVLDPFMGSGTTGVACKKLNRYFIGIELNAEYIGIAVNRINISQQKLF